MSGLFSKPKIDIPKPPEPPPPVPMPDPDDPAHKMDQLKVMAAARNRSGRASTILSSGGGSSDYAGTTLGVN